MQSVSNSPAAIDDKQASGWTWSLHPHLSEALLMAMMATERPGTDLRVSPAARMSTPPTRSLIDLADSPSLVPDLRARALQRHEARHVASTARKGQPGDSTAAVGGAAPGGQEATQCAQGPKTRAK